MTTTSARGVIERPTDVDLFAFSAGAGTATFKVTPAARSTNLDAWVGLRDAAGNLLTSGTDVASTAPLRSTISARSDWIEPPRAATQIGRAHV